MGCVDILGFSWRRSGRPSTLTETFDRFFLRAAREEHVGGRRSSDDLTGHWSRYSRQRTF